MKFVKPMTRLSATILCVGIASVLLAPALNAQSKHEERLIGWWTIDAEKSLKLHEQLGIDAGISSRAIRAGQGFWLHFGKDNAADLYMKSAKHHATWSVESTEDSPKFDINFMLGDNKGVYHAEFSGDDLILEVRGKPPTHFSRVRMREDTPQTLEKRFHGKWSTDLERTEAWMKTYRTEFPNDDYKQEMPKRVFEFGASKFDDHSNPRFSGEFEIVAQSADNTIALLKLGQDRENYITLQEDGGHVILFLEGEIPAQLKKVD
jgi:hypothetical protein